MDIYASDEEKAEEIKRWWRENGRSVVAGVIIGTAVIFGWRYWTGYQQVQAEQASAIYQQLISDIAQGGTEEAEKDVQQLMQGFPNTAYAIFSALRMAQLEAENQNSVKAEDYLNWVIDNASLGAHQQLAKLRLARLLFAQGKNDEALALAKTSNSTAFASLFAELEGDIHLASDDKTAAIAAFQRAILTVGAGEPRQILLQMKIDDVAVANEG